MEGQQGGEEVSEGEEDGECSDDSDQEVDMDGVDENFDDHDSD